MDFELRLMDRTLLRFWLSRKGAFLRWVDDRSGHLFPAGLRVSDDGVMAWIRRRLVFDREHMPEVRKALGFSSDDLPGILSLGYGLSLADSYWVVPAGFRGQFDEYGLFRRSFSRALEVVALVGGDVGGCRGIFGSTPELTTKGRRPKFWRFIEGDGIYLFKAGVACEGLEPYSEYYGSQIARKMGLGCACI